MTTLRSAQRNLESANTHPSVVTEYLKAELHHNRISGPFGAHMITSGHASRFGVIPKHHQNDKWCLIVDLSHPKGHSVNDGIPESLCSLKYITIDDAINQVLLLGSGTLMAKIDIQSAFRLLPVHAADRHLLQMKWDNLIFVDTCLPFGLRSAPKLFNILADLLQWISQQQGVSYIMHYLDDFLVLGTPGSNQCQTNLSIIKECCEMLGIPLALERVEDPSTSLSFLGIVIDTVHMQLHLPPDKLIRIRDLISTWLSKKSATQREILSLVGLLQHATKVLRCGRTFVSRMYATAAKVQQLDYYTRLNKDFRSDLYWWHTFLITWNGYSLLRSITAKPDFCIQTDASGSWGCGAYFNGKWFQLQWERSWQQIGIMAKELFPIVLSTAVWASSLARHKVLYHCDNSSVVAAICKGSARDATVMQLLRSLWFFTAHYDIDLACTHIAGVANTTADHLSRNNTALFFHRIHTLHCCLLHYQPHCYRSPASQDRIGHRHTSVSCSFLPSTKSNSIHTQALQYRHTQISYLLPKYYSHPHADI